ncbi:CRK like proto-oncogene, adaptor protein isoform X2 [Oratosquilla oratoria]|uniref:CRK like proto-oncogene, adaptor protein isoform X2 n=1 Tax=Oratosquilla oratoria TaxID=337810 RepID=UPI003F76B8FE
MFRRPHSAPVARSCSELNTTSAQVETENSPATIYWKSRSLEELPDEVAACFEDSSVLGRFQASILRLFGRGSRYKLNTPVNSGSGFMSLDAFKQRLSHVRKRWASHCSSADPNSAPNISSSSPICCSGVGSADTPTCGTTGQLPHGLQQRLENDLAFSQRYSANAVDNSADDANLLEQYMSLYNLAMGRKNCNNLRKIRDSLVTKARSPPPAGPLASPSNLLLEREALRNFLLDIGFVQYYSLFNRHGYDLRTATHMEPLDLAAIGITEPLHRMAIKFELDQRLALSPSLEKHPHELEEDM